MAIVLTGAGGFLGKEILAQASKLDIVAVSGQDLSSVFCGKVLDRNMFFSEYKFSSSDVLINCAFPRNTDGVQMADGLEFTARLFRKAADEGAGAVINISSQSVYSQKRMESADEKTQLNLESGYAIGKYATELLLDAICCGKIPNTNIRMASLVGIGFEQRLVNKLVRQALKNKKINIYEGRQQFGLLDVRDAASAILLIADSDSRNWYRVYNLGTDRVYTLREIAKIVQDVVEKETNTRIFVTSEKRDDVVNSGIDAELFFHSFQWKPQFTLQDTVRDIYKHIQAFEKMGGVIYP